MPAAKRTPSKSLEPLLSEFDGQEQIVSVVEESLDDNTRQDIARRFVRWYFALFLLILIGVPIYNLAAFDVVGDERFRLDLIDTLQAFSSVIGPLIGFVVAYYFKSRGE